MMEKEEVDDVRKLLSYPEDSAGGIMTTEYAYVPPDVTAEQAIQLSARECNGCRDRVLCIRDGCTRTICMGVFSLKDLIFADPTVAGHGLYGGPCQNRPSD